MKIRLVFDDWRLDGESIYSTLEGIELSMGPFHSGTIFDVEIDTYGVDDELAEALAAGYRPVFYAVPEKKDDSHG